MRIPQSNSELRGTWRGVCHAVPWQQHEHFPPIQVEWTLGSKVLVTSFQSFTLETTHPREECGE
jgi:hypothetical protein